MKKVFAFLAVAALVVVSCGKKNTEDSAIKATITANDVTVEVGKTAAIGATTNSTATITYASANTAIATVSAAGEVTGVAAGTTTITLKVEAVAGKFKAAEKTINVTVSEAAHKEVVELSIDGKFDDWAALEKGTYSQRYGDPDATHPALTFCKVYATANYIYVYVEWDTDMIEYVPDVEHVPFHCYINSDGKATTGGFADQFTDACIDVLTEGWFYDSDGMGSYDPGVYTWIGEDNGSGWSWSEHLIPDGSGLGVGAGVEGKYEFALDRAVFTGLGLPIADEFSIGFDIQQNWDSVGVIPNEAPSEENPAGTAASLKVVTQK